MKEGWESLEKESHPNKPLQLHIDEIKRISLKFLKFYSFPTSFYRTLEYLAEYHDYGKRHKSWNIKNKSNPHHSFLSVKYLQEHKKIFESKKEDTFLLWYLIAKHHSSLTKYIKDPHLQLLVDEVKERIKNLDFDYKVNLIDVFGLFKIADACSAENKEIKLEKPFVSEGIVKRIISKKIDMKRWLEQQKLIFLPNFSLLRAYTGWGKTDASLLFFKNKSANKIFYLFPTITAINKFYQKLKNVLNDNVIKYFYFYDTEIKEDLDLLQNIFFTENFVKPVVITTIDQFLLSFLQVGKYYRKRVMFRNCGIILDEVHLLNPLMLKLVIYFLKKFREIYDFKVLFMSATLPKSLKKYLMAELNLVEKSFLDFSKEYKVKRRVLFEYCDKDLEFSIQDIIKEFKKGKKVIVVANTVEKSINVAEKLVKELGKNNVLLLHARFMYKDRKDKENEIENLKTKPHILVTTQVCEVSLDISYDFMFTELAPITSLIQRFGRVNRYGVKTDEVNVKIFEPKIKDKRYYPYTPEELDIAREVVKELGGDNLKDEFQLLENLDKVYTYENFTKILEKETKKIDLIQFEELLQFFFSLDISEEELLNLLSYRNSFTTLVIPHPECIEEDIETKEYIENLLKENLENKNFVEKKQLFAKFKEVSVPVPIWWIFPWIKEERKIFPIIDFKDKVYNSFYGFKEIKSEII